MNTDNLDNAKQFICEYDELKQFNNDLKENNALLGVIYNSENSDNSDNNSDLSYKTYSNKTKELINKLVDICLLEFNKKFN